MMALYKALIVTGVISTGLIFVVTQQYVGLDTKIGDSTGFGMFVCALVGMGVTALLVWITEYYTGTEYRPVRSVAHASQTGHGTNVIQGLAMSLEATAAPALAIHVVG
jgi:K(+)-stimulated pyrophosphate-energized sodium pump